MRSKNLILSFAAICLLFSTLSCEKETEEFTTEAIADYLPMTVGKYITYRIDSTVFTNFGRTEEIHKYQVKHMVDAQVTDNLGRASYRILRYLRDSSGTQSWVNNGTYFITPLTDQVEVIEDNLRYIKLHLPFKLNNDWKGNKYLSDDPFASLYTFSNDDDMNDWDYTMANMSTSGNPSYNVYTIDEADESHNESNGKPVDPTFLAFRTLATESYAKGIGMIARKFIMWEYQPASGGGYKTGFGINMWMIDHN